MSKSINIKSLIVGILALVLSTSVNAGILTFDDRAVFETFVNNYTVDGLDDIASSYYSSGIDRGDYAFTTPVYGCSNSLSCGDNSNQGFSYRYMSTYGDGSFVFDTSINAFGMDFGIYDGSNYGSNLETTIYLNGYSRTVSAIDKDSFFGIVDTVNSFDTISYSRDQIIYDTVYSNSGGIVDNITYGVVSAVPVPTAVWLFGSGLIGLARFARKKA